MSTPLQEPPDHLLIPVGADGLGPLPDSAAPHHHVCWCGCPHSARPPEGQDEVRQIAVHPAAWGWLRSMLASRGFTLGQIPAEPGDLPTYIMVPTDLEGS